MNYVHTIRWQMLQTLTIIDTYILYCLLCNVSLSQHYDFSFFCATIPIPPTNQALKKVILNLLEWIYEWGLVTSINLFPLRTWTVNKYIAFKSTCVFSKQIKERLYYVSIKRIVKSIIFVIAQSIPK